MSPADALVQVASAIRATAKVERRMWLSPSLLTFKSVVIWVIATIERQRMLLKRELALFAIFSAMVLQGCATLGADRAFATRDLAPGCQSMWGDWMRLRQSHGRAIPWGVSAEGVPVLRGTRVLAASATSDSTDRTAWLAQALATGMVALRAEWAIIPKPAKSRLAGDFPARMKACTQRWTRDLAQDAQAFERIRAKLEPADNYSVWARVLGLYPAAVPFMRLGIADWQGQAKARLAADWAPPRAMHYQVGTPPAALIAPLRRSAQLLPDVAVPDDQTLLQVLARHAPRLSVGFESQADQLGAVAARSATQVAIDVNQPTVYVQLGSARLLGAPRLQLIYTVWFPRRAAKSWLDSYAGELDGLIWRVTVDKNGHALAYDSIHPCGCFHMIFPATDVAIRPVQRREQPIIWPLETGRTTGPMHIGLSAGDHQIVHLAPVGADETGQTPASTLAWQAATDLLALQAADGSVHSLYQANGLVRGTARAERFYLWPSGVPSAGAMRVWGQHATAFVGRAHFDDPDLLESWLSPVIKR